MKKKLLFFLCCCVLFLSTACTSAVKDADLSAYADAEITISGLTDNDFTVTIADLAALEQTNLHATATRSNGERVSVDACGPLLDTFLAQYGKRQADFDRIRFTASDNYSIAITHDVLANKDIVLALSDGGKTWTEEEQPLRVVIPEERAMYWVRKIVRMDFESDVASEQCRTVVMLDAAINGLPAQDYDYYGVTDQAVSTQDLLHTYAPNTAPGSNVYLVAADGLEKNETEANFLSGQLKFTGADSPRLVSPEMPEGMQISDLVWIGYGDTKFLTLSKLISLYGQGDSIYFLDVIEMAEGLDTTTYQFDSVDGSSMTISSDDLAEATLTVNDDGQAVLNWSGGEPVVDILRIEAVS